MTEQWHVHARDAEAYQALIHIREGDWDDYAIRLYTALLVRLRSPEVQARWALLPTTKDGSEWEPGTE